MRVIVTGLCDPLAVPPNRVLGRFTRVVIAMNAVMSAVLYDPGSSWIILINYHNKCKHIMINYNVPSVGAIGWAINICQCLALKHVSTIIYFATLRFAVLVCHDL